MPIIIMIMSMVAALLPSVLYAESDAEQKERELQEREQKRIDQALENLGSARYELVENSFYKFQQMGEEAVPLLMDVLRDKKSDRNKSMNAIHALGRLGANAKLAVPVMLPLLKENDKDIRAVTAIALGKMGIAAKDAVPQLAKLLYEQDAWVSESAKAALRAIRTREALAALKEHEN